MEPNFSLLKLAFKNGDRFFTGLKLGLLEVKAIDCLKINLFKFLIAFGELNIFDLEVFEVSGEYFVIVPDSSSVHMILVNFLL